MLQTWLYKSYRFGYQVKRLNMLLQGSSVIRITRFGVWYMLGQSRRRQAIGPLVSSVQLRFWSNFRPCIDGAMVSRMPGTRYQERQPRSLIRIGCHERLTLQLRNLPFRIDEPHKLILSYYDDASPVLSCASNLIADHHVLGPSVGPRRSQYH